MYNWKEIGNRVRLEREHNKMSQDKLGSLIGTTRQTISKWEKGIGGEITLNMLLRLCDIFQCEMGYILCEYDCKTRELTDICESTNLPENVASALINTKSAYALTFLGDLLLCPPEMIDEIGKRYISYLHAKNYVVPQARALGASETDFLPDIKVGGMPLLKVPLKDLEEYSRFEFYKAVVNFAEYKKE